VIAVAVPQRHSDPIRSSSHETIIRLEQLSKSFAVRRGWRDTILHPRSGSRAPALQSVTCDVRRGELLGLLGPNGAGKSTLFRILATLALPDSGRAIIAGHDVVEKPSSVRRVLAPVFSDERSLNWRLSAPENLRLFAALYGVHGPSVRQRIMEVLDVVELTDAAARPVGQYSSGMRQRLLLARALIARPEILLLDEPTRSLDPISARRFRAFLREEIVGRQGCTVLLATHFADEAMDLCDRVAVLHHGRLLAIGPAAELSARTAGDRYRVWTREPDHPAFAALEARGALRALQNTAAADVTWSQITTDIPGGDDAAAKVLATLVAERLTIARFERVHPSLADLIDRIVREAAS
jgi:ABC-2 type transport system ATP-binding protein